MNKLIASFLLTALLCSPVQARRHKRHKQPEIVSEQPSPVDEQGLLPKEQTNAANDSHSADDIWLKLSFDATTILFGAYFVQGEFRLDEQMSFLVHAGYVDSRITVNSNVNQLPGWALELGLGGRWYLMGSCMGGFFFQDYLAFDYIRTYTGTAVPFGGGTAGPNVYALTNFTNAGYSWVTEMGFFADFMAGLNTTVFWGAPNPPTFPQMNTFETRVNVGWAF